MVVARALPGQPHHCSWVVVPQILRRHIAGLPTSGSGTSPRMDGGPGGSAACSRASGVPRLRCISSPGAGICDWPVAPGRAGDGQALNAAVL